MIIWNDYKYGEEIYKSGSAKTTKWQYKELKTLILYMLINDFKPKEIKSKLEACCKDDIKYLKDKQKLYLFNKLINQVKLELPKKENLIRENYSNGKVINIYRKEIESIKLLNNQNLERVAFTLLVYCKWLGDMKWFGISKADIFGEAKLKSLNSDSQQKLLSKLLELGYVSSEVLRVDRRSRRGLKDSKQQMWSLTYLELDGDITFQISDYTNFVFRYLNYIYGGYFECANCGKIHKQNKYGNRVYCKDCIGYQPIETKIVVCINCGQTFEVDARNMTKTRCDECYKVYRRQKIKENVQKYRENREM